jgi:hypothetical protein
MPTCRLWPSGSKRRVNLQADMDVSLEHNTSISRAESDLALKMETVYFSETLVSTYKSTRRYIVSRRTTPISSP